MFRCTRRHTEILRARLGFCAFARRYSRNDNCFLFLQVLKCFTSLGARSHLAVKVIKVYLMGFPHSEISGSKVARHLPEAYRSHATSFIAFWSQGIHHTLLDFLLGNLRITCPPHSIKNVSRTSTYFTCS